MLLDVAAPDRAVNARPVWPCPDRCEAGAIRSDSPESGFAAALSRVLSAACVDRVRRVAWLDRSVVCADCATPRFSLQKGITFARAVATSCGLSYRSKRDQPSTTTTDSKDADAILVDVCDPLVSPARRARLEYPNGLDQNSEVSRF
jgi:hypothetical protein